MNFDLNAPLVPGRSAAGVRLGESINRVLEGNKPGNIEDRGEVTFYNFGEVSLFVCEGVIYQVGVHNGYSGAIRGVIIGTTIAEVNRLLGPVVEDEDDNLAVDGIQGWCFESTEFSPPFSELADNLNATVKEMFVYLPRNTR